MVSMVFLWRKRAFQNKNSWFYSSIKVENFNFLVWKGKGFEMALIYSSKDAPLEGLLKETYIFIGKDLF